MRFRALEIDCVLLVLAVGALAGLCDPGAQITIQSSADATALSSWYRVASRSSAADPFAPFLRSGTIVGNVVITGSVTGLAGLSNLVNVTGSLSIVSARCARIRSRPRSHASKFLLRSLARRRSRRCRVWRSWSA